MEGFLLFGLFSAVPQGLELDLLKKKKKVSSDKLSSTKCTDMERSPSTDC